MNQLKNFIHEAGKTVIKNSSQALEQLVEEVEDPQQINVDKNKDYVDEELSENQFENVKIYQIEENKSNYVAADQTKQYMKIDISRVKFIEEQKKKIINELKQLDEEIAQIKGEKNDHTVYQRKKKINDDEQAKKNAQHLIKQLKKQKKNIDLKKQKQQERILYTLQKEEQQIKKIRQKQMNKIKEQKRQAIEKRMQQQKRKRQERIIINQQSKKLIIQLKKQKQIEEYKQKQTKTNRIIKLENRKNSLSKKSVFDLNEIQQHNRKYLAMKSEKKKKQQQQSLTEAVNRSKSKYNKNIWREQLDQQQMQQKEQLEAKQLLKKNKLSKRMKYGEIVKKMWISKTNKQEHSNQDISEKKPKTPEIKAHQLPQIKHIEKHNTQNQKKFKQKLGNKRNKIQMKIKQNSHEINSQENEIKRLKKVREYQLRKETKERLQKLQNSNEKIYNKDQFSQKKKYQNYLGVLKVKKKDQSHDWKKIMQTEGLSKDEKYKKIIQKATSMQKSAKMKQNLNKGNDEDSVNLYIGSIQAKLAVLQNF